MAIETKAAVRGVRLSADKGRLVADLIRGKKVDQALNIHDGDLVGVDLHQGIVDG